MTRKIIQYLFSLGLGPLREIGKHIVIAFFHAWLFLKKGLKFFGIPAITVVYDLSNSTNNDVQKIFSRARQPIKIEKNPLFQGWESIPHFDHQVYQIAGGKVFGCYTIATARNEIVWDLTRWHNQDKASNLYAYKFFPEKSKYLQGTTALITGNDTDKNYHHRITVVVPKFHLLQQSGVIIDQYIADTNHAFHQEGLQALGIATEKIIPSHPDHWYQCEKLLATNSSTLYGLIQPRVKDIVQELFLPQGSTKNPSRKLYIKRISNRKIANEQAFEELMQREGIEIVVMEGMTIRQQAQLFAEAQLIIGPHGAGLTNSIFCNPGTTLIELFHPATIFGHYYAMAGSLGLHYIPVVGETVKDKRRITMDQDMSIDIDNLYALLRK